MEIFEMMMKMNFIDQTSPAVKEYSTPKTGILPLTEQALAYLTEIRGLDAEVIERYGIGSDARGRIAIPFADENGVRRLIKFRHPTGGFLKTSDGNKAKSLIEPKGKPVLLGSHLADPAKGALVICFGDYDAIATAQDGVENVVALPFGDSGLGFLDHQWDFLEKFDEIILYPDADTYANAEAEARAAKKLDELATRLGKHRLKIVPREGRAKDANEVLLTQGAGANKLLVESAVYFPSDIIAVADYQDEIIEEGTPTGLPDVDRATGGLGDGQLIVISGDNGSGKALALDTPLPTPTGWTTMGEVEAGDYLINEKGKPCRVLKTSAVMENHKCYKVVFSDGSVITADAEHLWFSHDFYARVSERRARNKGRLDPNAKCKPHGKDQRHLRRLPRIYTTKEIANSLWATKNDYANHAVKVTEALELPEAHLEIDPYVFGVWLGDGASEGGRLYCADLEIIEEIKKCGITVTKHKDDLNWGLLGLRAAMVSLGVLNNKHIPAKYLRAGMWQRFALLQGLMDTDGTIGKNGTCEFTSCSKILAEQTLELILSLGFIATMASADAKLNGRIVGKKYRIYFAPNRNCFRLPRKAARFNQKDGNGQRRNYRYIVDCIPVESVPVKCVMVDSPSHLYLAGKTFIPTHNTTEALNLTANFIAQRVPVFWWSGEQKVGKIRYWFERIIAGRMNLRRVISEKTGFELFFPLDEVRDDLRRWYRGHLFQLTRVNLTAEEFFGRAELAVRRYGCKLIVIDNLMAFTGGEGEGYYQMQGDFAESCKRFAEEWNVAVLLICHNKKEEEGKLPTKNSIEGSKKIQNWADVIIQMYRVPEARSIEFGEADAILRLCKTRESGILEDIRLVFDRESNRFCQAIMPDALDRLVGWELESDYLTGRKPPETRSVVNLRATGYPSPHPENTASGHALNGRRVISDDRKGNLIYQQGADIFLKLTTAERAKHIATIIGTGHLLCKRIREKHLHIISNAYGFNWHLVNSGRFDRYTIRDESGEYTISTEQIKQYKVMNFNGAPDGNDYELQYFVPLDVLTAKEPAFELAGVDDLENCF